MSGGGGSLLTTGAVICGRSWTPVGFSEHLAARDVELGPELWVFG